MDLENSIIVPFVEAVTPHVAELLDAGLIREWMIESSVVDGLKTFISAQADITKVKEVELTKRMEISSNKEIRCEEIKQQINKDNQEHEVSMCGRKESIAEIIELSKNARDIGDLDRCKLHSQQLTTLLLMKSNIK